ncbi:MAG: PIN domain-containing protein [Gallionella sp.]|nr:PIN domain-containing protein [Gallionella sp.]
MRIFLDANILFSAARADGAVRKLLALTEAAGHELWADAYVFEEARRNLAAKTPGGLPVLNAMAGRIKIGGMSADNSLLPDTVNLPEKDRPVLAAAVRHHCDILVTGDRTHFGQLYGKTIQGVSVLSPAMLAETVLG